MQYLIYPAFSAIPIRLSAGYYRRSRSVQAPACYFQISRMAAFNIHVRLDLAMVLLALPVGVIEINDFLVQQGKVRPQCCDVMHQNSNI